MRIKLWILLPVALLALIAFTGVVAQETADEQQQEQEQSGEEMPEVITTEWLNKRYGSEEDEEAEEAETPPAPESKPAAPSAGTAPAEGKPAAEKPAAEKKEMTAEERAARIKEIEGELERLDKRLLSLRNPYLRGVTPPTEKEQQELEGKNNIQQIEATEKKIEELKKEMAELKSAG